MENLFVSYKQAIALKELGFDESCVGYYDLDGLQITTHHWYPGNKNSEFPLPHTTNNPKVSAPTFAQAFRWFRNVHNLHGCIDLHTTTPTHWYIRIDDIKTNDYLFHSLNADLRYDTYESAEQACLNKLILKKININNIKKCIDDGKYCAIEPYKHNWKDWIIDSIDFFCDEDYKSYYGDDVFLKVKIYHTKTSKKHTFSNGFQYTTDRIIKMSDISKY